MRLDLAERLRCPRSHAPTPLVVVASETVGRDLRRGVAGCVVCRYEARVEDGDLLAEGSGAPPRAAADEAGDGAGDGADPERIRRLVALLGLAEPGGAVLLLGDAAALATGLADAAGVAVVTDRPGRHRGGAHPVSAMLGFGDAVPFAEGTFRGAAIGAGVTTARIAAVLAAMVPGVRVVGDASLPVPHGLRELARDQREWVAEVQRVTGVVGITRRG